MSRLVCTRCGNVGYPKSVKKGSLIIEIILWLFYLIPGLIYSVWRHHSTYYICSKCGHDSLIPADSPLAKRYIEENRL